MGAFNCSLLHRSAIYYVNFGLFVILITTSFSHPAAAQSAAQSAAQFQENTAQIYFPRQIVFKLKLRLSAPLQKVTLLYGTNAQSCQEAMVRQALEVPEETSYPLETEIEWTWDLSSSGGLPPGAKIWWQWEVDDGSLAQSTEKKSLLIEDTYLKWQTLHQGRITLYWAEGGKSFAQAILDMASQSLAQLANEAGIVFSDPLHLFIYPSTLAMQRASLGAPDWAGGLTYPGYRSILVAIDSSEMEWAEAVIPHEIAHLVLDVQLSNCLGIQAPTWLNEGLAVYAEGPGTDEDITRLKKALDGNYLPPLSNLASGFPADAQRADLAYILSGQVVRFLIQNYGPEKLGAFLNHMRTGQPVDAALESVYDFNTLGLDNAWRASLGYFATPGASSTIQEVTPIIIPTLPLWTPVFGPTSTMTPTLKPIETTARVTPTSVPKSAEAASAPAQVTPPINSRPDGLCGSPIAVLVPFLAWLLSRRRPN